jgi:small subunit ribosomal protein S17
MERKVATRRTVQGVVVSDKNDKTIVVLVETHKRHAKYGKRVKYGKKYYAHDENNEAKNGDTVTIMETRRLSATKRFRLVSIDKKAVLSVKEAEAELKEEILEAEAELKEEAPKAEEVKVEEVKAEEAPKEAAPAKKPAARKAKAKKEEEPKEESK